MLGPVSLENDLHSKFSRAQAFMPNQILGFIAIFKFLFEEILCWTTRPVEVFLRRKFGIRSHGLFQALQICITGICLGLVALYFDLAVAAFCLIAAALAVYHRIETVRWEKNGPAPRFTWSDGEPVPWLWAWIGRGLQAVGIDPQRFLTISLICRFYEPLLVLLIGISVQFISKPLGYYLIGCSVMLFIKGVIVHQRMLTLKRDQMDARIISQWMVSFQRTVGNNKGSDEVFVVQLAAPPAPKSDGGNNGTSMGVPEQEALPETGTVVDDRVEVICRKCKKEFRVHRRHQGKRGKCKCGEVMVLAAETK